MPLLNLSQPIYKTGRRPLNPAVSKHEGIEAGWNSEPNEWERDLKRRRLNPGKIKCSYSKIFPVG